MSSSSEKTRLARLRTEKNAQVEAIRVRQLRVDVAETMFKRERDQVEQAELDTTQAIIDYLVQRNGHKTQKKHSKSSNQ